MTAKHLSGVWIGIFAFATTLATATQAPQTGPVRIPKEGEGYQITRTEASQEAPEGFVGRTDTSIMTAVGNTPETAGKRIVANFKLGNQVRTCPKADGTTEGEGIFSMAIDSTTAGADGTSSMHIEMLAKAQYTGMVGEDAFLDGPVNARIRYTYTQSGSLRDRSGALATPASPPAEQQVTIPIIVSPKALEIPGFGPFAGGDPTQGRYVQSFLVGSAVAYWAGVYYSIAQFKWRSGECVKVAFDPPGNTVQPPIGAQMTVSAEVKTKGGQSASAKFEDVRGYAGATVVQTSGQSGADSLAKFTYTSPNKPAEGPGFRVTAISRAGIAEGEWITGLGTDWSGRISCVREVSGHEGRNDQQVWSDYDVTRLTIDVKDGVGKVAGYAETKHLGINYLPSGAIETSSSTQGIADRTARATMEVQIEPDGTYQAAAMLPPMAGRQHSTNCVRTRCTETDQPLSVDCLSGISGKTDDPNHLRGSLTDNRQGLGRMRTGKMIYTMMWDLARKGSTGR